MSWSASLLPDGRRLHLQHGPIDLIIAADCDAIEDRKRVFAAAQARFDGLLEELVAELPLLRAEMQPATHGARGTVARRMLDAVRPHCSEHFITPMAAVAGAVSDEILAAMRDAAPMRRAYVNNGGDISLHLSPGERYVAAMFGLSGDDLGRVNVCHSDRVGGIATSGAGGRSFSFGIADSVTVLAASAAVADAAATLIANHVNLPFHTGIRRRPARELQHDTDLGDRPVVTHVPRLGRAEIEDALASGMAYASHLLERGVVLAVSLALQGHQRMLGHGRVPQRRKELSVHV